MAFDGSGNYAPPSAPAFPAVGGQTIVSTYYNQVINDIASALSICFTRDGQGKPTADLDFNNKSVANVNNLTVNGTLTLSAALAIAQGGTGQTGAPANGQLLIGNAGAYSRATLTAGAGIAITNGAGSVTVACSGALTASGFTADGTANAVLLGRYTASSGAIQTITIGAGLALSAGGVLSATGGGSSSIANLTFNSSGGAAPGAVYNGSGAKTIDYHTVGAACALVLSDTVASTAAFTPDPTKDLERITALAANLTINAPGSTPEDGRGYVLSIKDNGTARTLAFNAIYRAVNVTLPTTTVSNKILYLGMIYNAGDAKWDVLSVQQQ